MPLDEGGERRAPPRRYSTIIGSCNVKMVPDRHRRAAYITSTRDELLRNVIIDDLE